MDKTTDDVSRMREFLRKHDIPYGGHMHVTPEGLEKLAALLYVAYEEERENNRRLLVELDGIRREASNSGENATEN